MILLYIITFSILDGLAGIIGASVVIFKLSKSTHLIKHLVSFAAGAMFAAAFFDLIPEAIEFGGNIEFTMTLVLLGILLMYLLEKFLLWSHCHDDVCDTHRVGAPLVMVGDTLHNFLDGAAVAAAFLINIPLGIVTAMAVFFHELPQEMGDIGTLLHFGYTKRKALIFNIISEIIGVLGAVIVYFLSVWFSFNVSILLAIAAGGFIYIAGSDLLPEVHRELPKQHLFSHTLIFIFGIVTLWVVGQIFHV